MRILLSLLTLAAVGLGPAGHDGGLGPSAVAADAPRPNTEAVLLRWHFQGTARLAGNTEGTLLRDVCALPSTRRLVEEALSKLARAPQEQCRTQLTSTNLDTAALLRPLLDDLVQAESFGECRGTTPATAEWSLAVRLDAARAQVWDGNSRQLSAAFGGTAPRAAQAAGFDGWESTRPSAPTRLRLLRAGGWVVVSWGNGRLSAQDQMLERLRGSGHPATAGNGWLDLEADLAHWAPALGLPMSIPWPRARMTGQGRGPSVRSNVELVFPRPLDLALAEWQIPTNTIREPLISFTAVQGLRAWLQAQPWVKQLGIDQPPNQLFAWGLSQVPFETYAMWRMPNSATVLPRIAKALPGVIETNFPLLKVGEVTWEPRYSQILWRRLPILVPYLQPAPGPDHDFVLAGVFPTTLTNQPPGPPELFSQVLDRTNLVYYDWEITQNRLQDWRSLISLYSMVAGYVPPPTNSAAYRWLMDTNLVSHLGNAATEVTVVNPRVLAVTRTSSVGFTGLELALLARWVDSPTFPAYRAPELISQWRQRRHPATPPPRLGP